MTNQIRLGAIFWVLTVGFFIAQFVAQSAYPDYSLIEMDISLLGVTSCGSTDTIYACSPGNSIFNLGMTINGVCIALGAWLTRRLWPQVPLAAAALWLLAIGGGGGGILIGLFPVDVYLEGHLAGAILTLFVASLGIALLGAALWNRNRAFALYALVTGVMAILATGFYLLEIYLGLGRGTMERIAAWSHTIWFMVAGGLILQGYFSRPYCYWRAAPHD